MTETQVQGNRIIAEFMGTIRQDTLPISISIQTPEKLYVSGFEWFVKECAKYHTSWEWLMPVVEKIESMGYCVFIQNDCCWIKIGRAGMKPIHITHLSDSKIEATWKAAVELINQTK